jgi:zinc D-Ala-D-Ala dipeptidase
MRFLLLLLFWGAPTQAGNFDQLARQLAENDELRNVSGWDGLHLDIRYATRNNFTGRNIYGRFNQCFLHKKAAKRLKKVVEALQESRPHWKLRVFDCLRPRRAQQVLFDVVKGTPQQGYVRNPAAGSVHNYGFALDASLSDERGREVDMGTPYDFFGALGQPRHEQELLRLGKLTQAQLRNREVLRSAMREGDFRPISTEWWHFDALSLAEVRENYELIE